MLPEIIAKTQRVPVTSGPTGKSEHVARQLDVALMSAGFKLSKDLLEHLSSQHPVVATDLAKTILGAVKELVGDHVQHNVYFLNFPQGVPDTFTFWWTEIVRVFLTGNTRYGRYQHSYQEMIALHDEFISSVNDRITVLHLGKTLPEEALDLYHSLATSPIPLNEADRVLVKTLAEVCLTDPQPASIPVRETKAIINSVRIQHHQSIEVDTLTDILRLACALSDGDVTLQEATKFQSFGRGMRRTLLDALNTIIAHSPDQLADVHQYRERWKRLAERLHPREYTQYPYANEVFAVAYGEKKVSSLEAKVEIALLNRDIAQAISLLSSRPGVLVRSLDRIVRAASERDTEMLLEAVQKGIERISGRVLLSFCEHLHNRGIRQTSRIFTTRRGTAWATSDSLKPLDATTRGKFLAVFEQELLRRLPSLQHLLVDPEILQVAIPLSNKNKADGFAILPRGSIMPVADGILRFFIYWKQASRRTDYDLSAIMLDDEFKPISHLSYTNLKAVGGVHSGDLTEAPHGASEFIDIDLSQIAGTYLLPTVDIYAGEGFTEVESCFFGMMHRTPEQKGKPFEAATVRIKSDLRGKGRVALPLVFSKNGDGTWSARWMHLYLKGMPNFNRVEANRVQASVLVRSILERQYLSLQYLIEFLRQKANSFAWQRQGANVPEEPVTFIGLEVPENLPKNSMVYTLANLHALIPS